MRGLGLGVLFFCLAGLPKARAFQTNTPCHLEVLNFFRRLEIAEIKKDPGLVDRQHRVLEVLKATQSLGKNSSKSHLNPLAQLTQMDEFLAWEITRDLKDFDSSKFDQALFQISHPTDFGLPFWKLLEPNVAIGAVSHPEGRPSKVYANFTVLGSLLHRLNLRHEVRHLKQSFHLADSKNFHRQRRAVVDRLVDEADAFSAQWEMIQLLFTSEKLSELEFIQKNILNAEENAMLLKLGFQLSGGRWVHQNLVETLSSPSFTEETWKLFYKAVENNIGAIFAEDIRLGLGLTRHEFIQKKIGPGTFYSNF